MRIRISIFIMLFSNLVSAQCPTISFTADTLLCSGDTFNIINTSIGGQSYLWDFCPGDIENGVDTNYTGDYSASLSGPVGNKLVYSNGSYHCFTTNLGGNLVRFDFGNSLLNTPTITDLGNFGFIVSLSDISIIQEDTLWYAIMTSLSDKLYKVSFGSNIANNSPAISSLIIPPASFAASTYIETIKEGANYFAFCSDQIGNVLSIINLGSDLTNDTATVTNISLSQSAPMGVVIKKECNQWFAFVGFLNTSIIEKLEFGNSILNTPTSSTIDPFGGGIRDMQLVFDGGSWFFLMVDAGGGLLVKVGMGNSLSNPNQIKTLVSANPTNTFGFDFIKVNSEWQSMIGGISDGQVYTLNFINSCNAPNPSDTSFQPTSITFSANGYQTYTFESKDSSGNFSYTIDSVNVNPKPIVQFDIDGSCINSTILFNDSSYLSNGTITNWLWNFGDGSSDTMQNTSHIYTITGNYNVSIEVTADNGCSLTMHDSISIENRPTANFGFSDNQCMSKSILFTDSTTTSSGSPAFWFWNFGDGSTSTLQNPSHTYGSPGTYTVQLVSAVSLGCNDTISKQITIIPAPEPDFTILNTCVNDTSFFINTTTIQSGILTNYFWNFGDGDTSVNTDPLHNYAASINTYNVMLIAYSSNGCSDTLNRDIKINLRPVPGFIVSDTLVCVDELITFSDTSTVVGDTITSVFWNFGDSNTDTNPVALHSYSSAGIYTVTLNSFSPSSCDSSISKTITVIDKPNVSFTNNTVCNGDTVNFINTTIPAVGSTIISTNWNFGDNTTDTLLSPSHLYNNFGIYNVSLLVTDDKGCVDADTQAINIFDVPVANFNLSARCSDINIQFTDASIVNGDSIQQWLWNFGDTGTSNSKNPIHLYTTPGTYTIELIVISSQGCSDTISKTFNFNQTPLATFNSAQTCDGNPVPFTYLPTVFPSPVTNWLWTFGDGGTSTIINPAHIYASSGSYTVSLTVSDTINNCSSTVSKSVSVDPIPIANFTWSGNCQNEYIKFTDSSSINSGAIIDWNWKFGDGFNGTGNTVKHKYDTIGLYNVSLITQSLRGCSDSVNKVITINEIPLANFTFSPSFGSAPIVIDFNNASTGASAFYWDFGDTTVLSNSTNPNHLYQNSGIYPITLVAENNFGCYDTSHQSINIFNPRNDIAIQNILTELDGNLLTVKVVLINVGNITIHSVQLRAQAESYGTISEFWTGNLEPNSSQQLYTFTAQFNIEAFNPPEFICVEAIQPNELADFNTSNNKLCIVLDNEIQFINPYPNPFTDELILGVNLPLADLMKITMFNSNGTLVKKLYEATTNKGLKFIHLETSTISDGYYLLQVEYLNKTYHFPVIRK